MRVGLAEPVVLLHLFEKMDEIIKIINEIEVDAQRVHLASREPHNIA